MLQNRTELIKLFTVIYLSGFRCGKCYITRLECSIHANFTLTRSDARYHAENNTKIYNIDMGKCIMNCITGNACKFYNYNKSNQTCEHIMALSYLLDDKYLANSTGWEFWSTGYYPYLRGPKCVTLNPCTQQPLHICKDTCEHPFYKCVNTALQLVNAGMYPMAPYHSAMWSINGILGHAVSSRVGSQDSYLQIHLSKFEDIASIIIYKAKLYTEAKVLVQDTIQGIKKVCTSYKPGDITLPDVKRLYCDNGLINGKFVTFQVTTYFSIEEIEVYGDMKF